MAAPTGTNLSCAASIVDVGTVTRCTLWPLLSGASAYANASGLSVSVVGSAGSVSGFEQAASNAFTFNSDKEQFAAILKTVGTQCR